MEDISIDIEKFTGLVIFSIDDWEFCVNFHDVLLILRGDELKHIEDINLFLHPEADKSDSEFLVLNLGSYFGLRERKISPNTRMLFINNKFAEFSFYADCIKEIITIDKEFVRKKLEFISISGTDYIKGLVKYENRTFLFPDYNRIVTAALHGKLQKTV